MIYRETVGDIIYKQWELAEGVMVIWMKINAWVI
jgi:hypothetical protein